MRQTNPNNGPRGLRGRASGLAYQTTTHRVSSIRFPGVVVELSKVSSLHSHLRDAGSHSQLPEYSLTVWVTEVVVVSHPSSSKLEDWQLMGFVTRLEVQDGAVSQVASSLFLQVSLSPFGKALQVIPAMTSEVSATRNTVMTATIRCRWVDFVFMCLCFSVLLFLLLHF